MKNGSYIQYAEERNNIAVKRMAGMSCSIEEGGEL